MADVGNLQFHQRMGWHHLAHRPLSHPNVLRGPTYDMTPEQRDHLLEWISDGNTLAAWLRGRGKEWGFSYSQVYAVIGRDAALKESFRLARRLGADAIAEDCLRIIDEQPEIISDPNGSSRRDSAYVAWAKNRAELRLKLLAKWDWERYGDKVKQEVTGADGGPVSLVQRIERVIVKPKFEN